MIVISRHRSRSTHAVKVEYVPTPEMIEEMTAAIRQTWTPHEHCRRANVMGYVDLAQMPLLPRRKGFSAD